ncbi:MAG: AAA family ATPase [Defluviitaleaceae bacterium]|nr:AAA family ATPase [Defluviitaleaceae bacterium]MCL2273399.1 AAA family ATPase [Defluviitaleaceae bacterium]
MDNQAIINITTDEEARAAIMAYQQKTGMSQNAIARAMGLGNASGLSQYMSDTYPAPHKMREHISQFLSMAEKREVAPPRKPKFVMTTNSAQVTGLIRTCHVQGEFGVAYGDPGTGKTMAVQQYAKDNPNSIVITVSPTEATITGVNELIAEKLKIKERLNRRIFAEIIAKLKGSKRVIIVDEAQHLKARVVNHLRCIVDRTEDEDTGERIGMALVGNDEIFYELKERQTAAYKQVDDRVLLWAHVVATQTKLEDIRQIFSAANFDVSTYELLHRISTSVSIRKAVQALNNAMAEYKHKTYAEVSAAELARVAKAMRIRVVS